MKKKLMVFLSVIFIIILTFSTVYAVNVLTMEGIKSVEIEKNDYNINDFIEFKITTNTNITKIKIENENKTTYYICDINSGFSDFVDNGDTRTWNISKKIQFVGSTTKTFYAGTKIGYSLKTDKISFSSSILDEDNAQGFVFANSTYLSLTTSPDEKYIIKGMAFGNNVWSNPSTPIPNHHTEESYKELAELGFNCVRFYLNYGLFEDDFNPYIYKQTGWDYLDENIQMAKKYNIKLILNMHYPQGGYQSQGTGMALWTNRENQLRLTALWKEIAKRYENETTIAGYDLVNEPIVPALSSHAESIAQWENLANEIVVDIRKIDQNHLIVVERLNGTVDLTTSEKSWFNDDDLNFFKINDDNICYQFHTYDPFTFTHQGMSWAGLGGAYDIYPNENKLQLSGALVWEGSSLANPTLSASSSSWTYLEGEKVKVDNQNWKASQLAFQCLNIGENAKVWFDDVVIKEYDENGVFVKNIASFNFDDDPSFGFWSENDSGDSGYSSDIGHTNGGSIFVQGTTSDANASCGNMFIPKQGYSYQVCGWAKAENLNNNSSVKIRTDFWNCDEVCVTDKTYLESTLLKYINWGIKNDVPLYLGEFGAATTCFEQNRGGEIWIEDMLDLCMKYDINFNYHTYHEVSFGLYANDSTKPCDNLNLDLYNVFRRFFQTRFD